MSATSYILSFFGGGKETITPCCDGEEHRALIAELLGRAAASQSSFMAAQQRLSVCRARIEYLETFIRNMGIYIP